MTLQVKSTYFIRSIECLAHRFLCYSEADSLLPSAWTSVGFGCGCISVWERQLSYLGSLWLLSLQVTFESFRSVKSFISKLVREADNLPLLEWVCDLLKISLFSWTSCVCLLNIFSKTFMKFFKYIQKRKNNIMNSNISITHFQQWTTHNLSCSLFILIHYLPLPLLPLFWSKQHSGISLQF